MVIKAGASFPLDGRFLGRISVVGKDDPLIYGDIFARYRPTRIYMALPA